MNVRTWSVGLLGALLAAAGVSRAQAPTSAKIEAIPLELKAPDRYQIYSVVKPIRNVTITAPVDGILRSLEIPVGTAVRESQEIAQLDRGEAAAQHKIAQASVKEAKAALKGAANAAVAQARLEEAEARADLAQLMLDRCTLRAPFSGRLLEVSVSPGQFLPKGAMVAELADVSSLRVLVPFARAGVTVGASVNVDVEGQVVAGKVQATLPLPDSLSALRELAAPFSAAWVILPNPKGEIEPGQRVLSPSLPTSPIATIPSRALRQPERGESAGPSIQVIRNEYVANVPVRVLGHPGPERVQVTGLLRPNDALIVSASVPLLAGTLIRFSGGTSAGLEATNPNPAEGGEVAGIVPPRAGSRNSVGAFTRPRSTSRPTTKPGTGKGSAAPPF